MAAHLKKRLTVGLAAGGSFVTVFVTQNIKLVDEWRFVC